MNATLSGYAITGASNKDLAEATRQGNYGEGREVRLKLGLPVKD